MSETSGHDPPLDDGTENVAATRTQALTDENTTLIIIIASCSAVVILLIIIVVALLIRRRKNKTKLYDVQFDDINGYTCQGSRSAPISRQPSPRLYKRGSCPNTSDRTSKWAIARALMNHDIPDFTLPPERIQPRVVSDGWLSDSMTEHNVTLGSVQPELYLSQTLSENDAADLPDSVHGRLWYSMVYDGAVETLHITLKKAKGLVGRGKHGNPRDPFVKVYMLPDESAVRVSKVKKKTLTPIFNETFDFQISPEELPSKTVRFSVYDVDKRRIRHSLGHVLVPLSEVDLAKDECVCRDLEDIAQTSAGLGEVTFSLTYMPTSSKLKVIIINTTNLRQCDYEPDKGIFTRVQLMCGQKVCKTKRTETRRSSADTEFNESFTFNFSGRQVGTCRLIITMMGTGMRHLSVCDEIYGEVVLGSFMFARGEQLVHWQEMLSYPRTAVQRTHHLRKRSQLD